MAFSHKKVVAEVIKQKWQWCRARRMPGRCRFALLVRAGRPERLGDVMLFGVSSAARLMRALLAPVDPRDDARLADTVRAKLARGRGGGR
ncbi:hypothetical protein [Georgenia sp. SUBG003]|uniref:hypothetical protein n=1 Tax=Georgenia sp. SUBG003 TaxID=1497974 RepID=UPI003AB56329